MATKETKEVEPVNPRAIFSKTGKGVQEASGKTSHLSRADRAVLKEIDGKTQHQDIAVKFDKIPAAKFDALIQQLDKDGFIREVSSGAAPEPITPLRKATPAQPPRAAPPPPASGGGGDDDMDFTQVIAPRSAPPPPPKGPTIDLAAAARAEAERKAKEQAATDYRARQEAEAKAAAEARAKAEADARARAAAEAKAKAEADARARAEAEAKARTAEVEAKAKQARDMALRMAAEAKAKAEAEARDKARLEAELKGKLEEERKAREEAEKRAAEAAERARKEHEEKAKRDAEELRQRLEAEMKAKLEEERRAREEEDRKRREEENRRREEEDRRRKAEDERREKERAERLAKEEAERKQREEEDRKRREKEEAERRARDEADRKRREEEDRRRKEEDERRARERAKEEEERKRREKEEEERRARDERERKQQREEDERKRSQEAERREKEESERRAREESERRATEEPERSAKAEAPKPAAPAPAAGGSDFGSLLDDLDSFGQKEEEERKAKEEAERKAKADAEARARAEEERKRREEEDRKRREEEERRAKAEAERREKEEAERREREQEESRKAEEEERKRKAKEAQDKKAAEEKAAARKAPAAGAKDDDIGVSEEDLGMDDVKRDQAAISQEARRAAKEREEATAAALRAAPRPKKWGKPVAVALFVVLVVGVGALHVMPLSTADYEKAASEAFGAPVKVSSARLSVFTGVKVNLEGVTVGDTKLGLVRGFPEIGSLFGPKKAFSRIEVEGAVIPQEKLAGAIFAKAGGDSFRAGRIVLKNARLEGPLVLPPLDIDAAVGSDGTLQTIAITGPDKLDVKVTPGSGGNASFEVHAPSFALPFVPALALSEFGWKGTLTAQGINSSEFDGRAFDGVISGTARVRWGASWTVEGDVRARSVKVAVFAPTLVSDGKVEGRGNYTMSGPAPAKLGESARMEGSFKIENGVIGNFDLGRALQTGGAQTQGRTEFTELTGQGVYDKGTVQLRNLAIASRAMAAGASLDIDAGGTLAGRIAAEVKTPNQTLKAVLNITGTLQNPVVRK